MNEKSAALFTAITEATHSEIGYHMATEKQSEELRSLGLVEINPAITEGSGFGKKYATRLTAAGEAKASAPEESNDTDMTDTVSTPTAAPSIVASGFQPSEARRGGRRSSIYPFDSLEVGGMFFVAATADKPDPAKSLASTVNGATRRYAEPVLDESGKPVIETYTHKGKTGEREKVQNTREFRVQAVEAGKVYGSWTAPADGAVVYRAA